MIMIAIADDLIRHSVCECFAAGGHATTEETDGEDALAAIRLKAPRLVVLDYRLPRMNGAAVLRAMKADAHLTGIPVVMVGDEPSVDFVAKVLGAQAFVNKAEITALVEVARRLAVPADRTGGF